MMETLAIMFIFFILVAMGMGTYYGFKKSSIIQEREDLFAKKAIDVSIKVSFMPELACTRGEAELKSNCIDVNKLIHLKDLMKDKEFQDYFFDLFSYANVTVEQIYPEKKEYVIYEFPKPNWTEVSETPFVVVLKDDKKTIGNEHRFGVLHVEVFR